MSEKDKLDDQNEENNAPIIIKKIKKGGHGHHGGSWKIAYADFVTAMMAFFLLMWLLASLNIAQKQGLAEYFKQPVKVSLIGGNKTGSNEVFIEGGGDNIDRKTGQVFAQDTPSKTKKIDDEKIIKQKAIEIQKLKQLKTEFNISIKSDPALAGLKDQMLMDITHEGLRIQLIDNKNQAMFDVGSDKMNPEMEKVLKKLAKLLNSVPNKLSIQGHTDSRPYHNPDELEYTNWELSTQRANAARRYLLKSGLKEDKVLKVSGYANTVPLDKKKRNNPVNRRISIIIMKKDAETKLLKND